MLLVNFVITRFVPIVEVHDILCALSQTPVPQCDVKSPGTSCKRKLHLPHSMQKSSRECYSPHGLQGIMWNEHCEKKKKSLVDIKRKHTQLVPT